MLLGARAGKTTKRLWEEGGGRKGGRVRGEVGDGKRGKEGRKMRGSRRKEGRGKRKGGGGRGRGDNSQRVHKIVHRTTLYTCFRK